MSTDGIVLTAQKRTELGKGPARRLRAAGSAPAVIYGHGKDSVALSVDIREVTPFVHHTGLLKLKIEGRSRAVTAVIKDIQFDVLKGSVRHLDFQEVRADEIITATVSVETHGTAAGQAHGGMLEQVLHSLDIKCAANRLPEVFDIDVSGLEIDDSVCVRDIELPEGAVADLDGDQVVVMVVLPRVEEEPEEEVPEEGEVGEEEGAAEAEDGAAEPDGE